MSRGGLRATREPFEHVAMLYEGPRDFLTTVESFLQEGLDRGEGALVAIEPAKIDVLQPRFARADVSFVDIRQAGRNPAWIIPLWAEFVRERSARGVKFRGIGEPVWPERTADELEECSRHEALLNVAFSGGQSWLLGCPYDVSLLPQDVVEEAGRNHPLISRAGETATSASYRGLEEIGRPFAQPLTEAPAALPYRFGPGDIGPARGFVAMSATGFGLALNRVEDLVLASSEAVANSVRHGAGVGEVRCWLNGGVIVCEVRDGGVFEAAMAGRQKPAPGQASGFGLWMANQVCDLVQIRSLPSGTVVRLHMRLT
jgi:anti-sigma regulatory factor (Ser/Thr protein kinase)